ncbi:MULTISPECIES: IpaD/SipD/SspD family type III secretion system needle tip protein [unclassified Burkholderia]|uniref:IpaD/SipD/SspD family type III secretion system needle tip protein n=1 Tax=unclassified Burkholderia TaxID=2613784 RepID=UPI000AC30EE1|nr:MULTISPECIES: IpaD/SipD/SspD family type III secretion system needle tip protein [unclassified Burkholderia]
MTTVVAGQGGMAATMLRRPNDGVDVASQGVLEAARTTQEGGVAKDSLQWQLDALFDLLKGNGARKGGNDLESRFKGLALAMRACRRQRDKQIGRVAADIQVLDAKYGNLDSHAKVSQAATGQSNVGDDNPFQDIIDGLNHTMEAGQDELNKLELVVEAVMKLVQKISNYMAHIASYIHSSSDGKSISFDVEDAQNDLWNIMSSMGGTILHVDNVDQFKEELGSLIPSVISVDGNGNVSLNTDDDSIVHQMWKPLSDMNNGGTVDMNPAAYQAWWAGFQGLESQLENAGQTIAEKYSHVNSNFDNLVKVVSSTVQSMIDTDKQYLQI